MAAPHHEHPPRPALALFTSRTRRLGIVQVALLFALFFGTFLLGTLEVHAYQGAVTRGDFTIAGQYPVPVTRFTPAGLPTLNLVAVIAHGYGGSKSVMSGIGVELARAGITAYTFDFPGHGSSQILFAAGGHADYGSAVAAATPELDTTVDEVVRYAVAHGPAPGTQVILVGHSMGGAIITDYALHAPASVLVAGIALFSPAWNSPPNVSPDVSSLPAMLVMAADNDIPAIRDQIEQEAKANCGQPLKALGAETCTVGGAARAFHVLAGLDHISIVSASSSIAVMMSFLRQNAAPGMPATQVQADSQLHWLILGALAALLAAAPLLSLLVALLHFPDPAAKPATPHITTNMLLAGEGVLLGTTAGALLIQHLVTPSPFAFLGQLTAPDVLTVLTLGGILWLVLLFALLPPATRAAVAQSLPAASRQVLLAVLLFAFLYLTLGQIATTAYVDLALTVPKLWRFGVTTLLLLPYFGASEWLHGAYAATSPRLAVAFGVVAKAVVLIALASIVGNLLTFVLAIFLAFVGFEALSRRLVRVPFVLVPLTEALILAWTIAMVYQFVS